MKKNQTKKIFGRLSLIYLTNQYLNRFMIKQSLFIQY
ncbi:hypothetical protein pb186bvf_010970 [Paramecium bursaria]